MLGAFDIFAHLLY